MLSAVESHFGPGRAYSHHFAGPAVPSLLPHCPISTLPVLSSTAAAMSAAEFARPHPKPRYSNGPIRNGLTSPRSKYSEQTGPVNLAVSQQQTSTTLSLADTSISVPQTQSNIEPVSPSISNLYGPPKLPYCPPQVTGAHVYPSLNYPSLYARSYGPPAHYSPHPLTSRSQLHHTSSYIPSQLDSYSNYIPQVKITPPYVISSSQTSPNGNGSSSGKPSSGNERSQLSLLAQQQQQNSTMHNKDKESKLYLYVPTAKTHPTNVISSSDPVQTSSPSSYVRQQPCKASSAGDCTNTITSNDKAAGFKVPSGKEGSLKHRILTRPYADREVKSKPSIHGTIIRSTNNNNPSTNFTKGSLIELANGDLRPVEDMRTEDFILSSNKNPELQMADTTVVKIAQGLQNNVSITFSYNGNTFDMEATAEHPFFVYGHGWASCNPEGSIQAFGLKCQRLRVGDVCISLTPREPTSPLIAASTAPQSFYHNDDSNQIPQNLSKKPETTTIPTTATGTTVTSRPVPPFDCHQSLAFYASYLNTPSMNAAINAASMLANTTNNLNDERRHQVTTNHHTSLIRNMHTDDGSIKHNHQHISNSNAMSTTTCNSAASKHPSVSTIHRMTECNGSDAIFSKKRRWSAPVICDDEMCRKSGQKNCNHNNHVHGKTEMN